jgi:menaquinone-dependent protoporphyrinogen IX oxidase
LASPDCLAEKFGLMRKLFKILFAVFVILMVLFIASAAIITYDVAGALATDTHPLPNGAPVGQAIVVYDPGLTGAAKDAATKIGYDLQDAGYNVTLAGVKSGTAVTTAGYDVVVVGGPVYGGKPAKSIQEYLSSFSPIADQKVGVFGYGSITVDNNDTAAVTQDVAASSTLHLDAVAKIVSGNDVDATIQGFVNRLLA